MVQMKEGGEVITPSIELSFISHMVQMKVIIALLTISIVLFFISHMVQMKGSLQRFSSMQYLPLYPTWFR